MTSTVLKVGKLMKFHASAGNNFDNILGTWYFLGKLLRVLVFTGEAP